VLDVRLEALFTPGLGRSLEHMFNPDDLHDTHTLALILSPL
jgi:hypothetical protein